MTVEKLFDSLWSKYIVLAPNAKDIHNLFQKTQEKEIINDHIALRTISNKKCNIDIISKNFSSLGYRRKDYYDFKSKSLDAYYFIHENLSYPKVFISELRLNEFDEDIQNILNDSVSNITEDTLSSSTLVSSGRHWEIDYAIYTKLYAKSEYAAWFYVYGFTANHFTVFINDLEKFQTIQEINTFVKNNNYILSKSGGEIKGNQEVCLEQSSTLAQEYEVEFKDGVHKIPSCFYEFAKRYDDNNGKLYQGFVAASADKIFESTN